MEEKEERFIEFVDPDLLNNLWSGSAQYNKESGVLVRAISELQDKKTDLRNTIDVNSHQIIEGKSDLVDRFAIFEPKYIERTLRYEEGFMSSQVLFNAAAIAIGRADRFKNSKTLSKRFHITSPIVFSFISPKTYKIKASKRNLKFSISDNKMTPYKYSGQVFRSIVFSVGKTSSDSVDGDVARIDYSGSVEFIARRSLNVFEVYVVSRLVEKLLFILVGDHAGPMKIDLRGQSKNDRICKIDCCSSLYIKQKVTSGLERCWTLNKVGLDFGLLMDLALAKYNAIETAIELIVDARAEDTPPARFFKLVRALENIGRNLLPKGSEVAPKELAEIQDLLSKNLILSEFFDKRIYPIFQRPNSLGYTIDFAKNFFPFSPITDLNKSDISRFRGIEAHARAHQFSPSEISQMSYYSEVIDFVCRSFILKSLGLEYELLIQGIAHPSRFAWFIKNQEGN